MDKIQNNATEVANESANVAVETTSVKNVNYSYQPRTVLLDLTKIIIRGNLSNIHFTSPHFLQE